MMSTRSPGPMPFASFSSSFLVRFSGSWLPNSLSFFLSVRNTFSASSMYTMLGAMVRATLKTMWMSMLTFLPGYLPSMLRGDRSNRLAPARLATLCVSNVLPVFSAPYSSTDLMYGARSWMYWLPSGRMAYSVSA
eukprot:12274-Chlamydomonas_euryale.AAC.11